MTKRKSHVVNKYSYELNDTLNVCKFKEKTEEWLDFVVDCRKGNDHHFDIVEGPMADDTIWDYIEDETLSFEGSYEI